MHQAEILTTFHFVGRVYILNRIFVENMAERERKGILIEANFFSLIIRRTLC